jgi:hypothetical protein
MFAPRPLLLGLGCARGDASDRAGVVALARALQRAGRRPVLIDLLGERAGRTGRDDGRGQGPTADGAIDRIDACAALGEDATAHDLVALANRLRGQGRQRGAEPDVALVMADPLRLADVAAALNDRIVLFAPGDASSLAQLYAQVKAVRLAHGVTRYVAAFRDARSRQGALDAHRRLADTAARFLGAAIEFGGLIPAPDRDPRAWDRFAADAIGWACPLDGTCAPSAC